MSGIMKVGLCVPVSMMPSFPDIAAYSQYERVPCPDCGEQMWLGDGIKKLRDEEGVKALCMVCAMTDPIIKAWMDKHGMPAVELVK
jgi:predicted RNA-binding Zn-ribbon protein involved in translation (DUF1610 family)